MATLDLITKEDLQHFKTEMLTELKELLSGSPTTQSAKKWMRSADVRKLLNISPGTLQNLRINGTLTFTKVGGTMFYRTQDIDKMLAAKPSILML